MRESSHRQQQASRKETDGEPVVWGVMTRAPHHQSLLVTADREPDGCLLMSYAFVL